MDRALLDIWLCTTTQHEPGLLAFTVLIDLLGVAVSLRLFAHALQLAPAKRTVWLLLAGATAGSAVWMTHFVATIGFQHMRSTGAYDPGLTLTSLAIAVTGFFTVFSLAARGGPLARAVLGAALGPVLGGLHFVGVRALEVFGVMSFDAGLGWTAVAVGALGGAGALTLLGDGRSRVRMALAAVTLAGGVGGLHFIGMAALRIGPGGDGLLSPNLVNGLTLSFMVTLVALAVLGSVAGAILFSMRTRSQALESLRIALDAMPAGVALFDARDRLLMWNRRYAEQGGKAAGVLEAGRTFHEMLRAELANERYADAVGREEAWIEERLAARRQQRDEEQWTGEYWFRVQDRLTSDGGLVSVVTDVTGLKVAAAELSLARDRAEAANRAKSEFLANMSHELRTPLNGIVGLAGVLARSQLPPNLRSMAEVIESSSLLLERLLSDVLDTARVESGRLEVHAVEFDLRAALGQAVQLHRGAAEAKGLTLRSELAADLPSAITADPLRIQQILNNLLNNAVKFTEAGEVTLVARPEFAGSALLIEVRDTGIGFDAARAEALFDRFEQADGSVTRRFGGSGLGLAIARSMAELMGGSLTAASTPGTGSTFTLRLPIPAAYATTEALAA